MSLAKQVVHRPVLSAVIFALIAIMGLYTFGNLAVELFPETTRPMITVRTSYSGANPESVEKSLTRMLESALSNTSNLKSMRSTSSEGSSTLRLEFDYGVNLDSAKNEIRDKLDRISRSLPDGSGSPTIFTFDTNAMPIMRIAVSGNRSAEDLKELAEDYIQPRLEQIDGVAEAAVSGGRTRIVRVELSQNRLEAWGLSISSIASSLSAQNMQLGVGSIKEDATNWSVRASGEFESVEEIANTVVASVGGYGVRLSDLGEVYFGLTDEVQSVYINGDPGVYISIQKQSGSNTVQTADEVYSRLDAIRALMPADVFLRVVSDNTKQIRSTIDNLVSNALQGAMLAMAILFLFLRSVKSTLIIGISIPFSILATLLAMTLFGLTLNMMTMTGLILGVGMIVDASIVILENIYKYRERGAKPKIAAVLGSQEMLSSIISSNLTTICVFIPLIFFKNQLGMLGQIFQDLIFTVVIALLSSLMVAIFLVPVLASHYLPLSSRKEKPLRNPVLTVLTGILEGSWNAVDRFFGFALKGALKHRPTTILVVLGFIAITLSLIPRMHIALMPRFSDDSITLRMNLPTGTELAETKALMLRLDSWTRENINGLESVITTVGGSNRSHYGSMSIQLDASAEEKSSASEVQSKLRSFFPEYPSAMFSFSGGRSQQLSGGADIDIALRSQDLDSALRFAYEIAELLNDGVEGLGEAEVDLSEGLPQIEIVLDRERAYEFGVSLSAAARELRAALDGTTATTFRDKGRDYGVVLMLRPEDRQSMLDLDGIFVNGSRGRVALANFARIERGLGPVSISRENQARTLHINANILDDTRADHMETRIKELIDAKLVVPDGVLLSMEGSWQELQEQGNLLIVIITMALLLVFGVMAGQYESFKDPIINLFTIPLLVVGVVIIHAIMGQSLSMFTAIGVVMLIGIVVNNGIILVDYTNLLVHRGIPVREACLQAGVSRLRPVLMTALTTILGLVPMAFFPGEGSEMIQPIGLTVIGGLSSATLITLFFIPVVYSFFNEKRSFRSSSSHRQGASAPEAIVQSGSETK